MRSEEAKPQSNLWMLSILKLMKVFAILGRCLMVSVPLTQVDHYESIRLGRIQMAAATEMVLG